MEFVVKKGIAWKESADCILLGAFEGEFSPALKELDTIFKGVIKRAIDRKEFEGKEGQVFSLHTQGLIVPERLLIIGLGKKKGFTLDKVRQAAAVGAKMARGAKLSQVVSTLFYDGEAISQREVAQAVVEGISLGLYRFDRFKTKEEEKKKATPNHWTLMTPEGIDEKVVQQGVDEGKVVSESVNYVRELVNLPGNKMTPTNMARKAREIVKKCDKIKATVYNYDQVKEMGMGAFLSIARGSDEPLSFIVLEYWGADKKTKPVALVGKGITFDSGGISIKPSTRMDEMKSDMAGGAAVLGIMRVLGELTPQINVVGVIPAAENLPSGKAARPGDIVKSISGQTIEIANTDAEGRVILADALSYVKRYKPRMIIDIATLTGACIVALGYSLTGMMGNNKRIVKQMGIAGEKSGEKVWELPLLDEYDETIKSDVADVKNVGNRSAGTITGGLFLQRFTGNVPWIHLDIAGTSWITKGKSYQTKGATGIGVKLVWDFLKGLL